MTARSRVSRWRTWFVAASGLSLSCVIVAAAASACGLDVLGTLQPAQEGGTGGEAGAACVPRPEICGNGLDDDCNGKIDCADPACADHACVPRVDGWSFATVVNSAGGTAGVAD